MWVCGGDTSWWVCCVESLVVGWWLLVGERERERERERWKINNKEIVNNE